MTTPSLLQIDDRDPLIFYSPNSSWTRGGAPEDFDGTSTFTDTPGASATLTFTGTGISVWGTIQLLEPNTTTFVVSSYSVDGGQAVTFNATEKEGYQFQQKLFQSATLNDTNPHTIVVTLVNNGTFFIDYFLIIPPTSTSASSSSNTSSVTGPTTAAGTGAQSQSSRVILGAAVGGSLGGLALLVIAILAFLLCCKRRKAKNQMDSKAADELSPDPFITPASGPLPTQQYQPHEDSDRVSDRQLSPTSSGVIPPSSKAAQAFVSSPRGDSLHSRPLPDSPEPPGYNE